MFRLSSQISLITQYKIVTEYQFSKTRCGDIASLSKTVRWAQFYRH